MSNARDKANIPALNFSSTGIDDNATSTAITIDSSENVGIGSTAPPFLLSLSGNSQGLSFTDTSGGTNAKAWLMQGLDSDFRLRTQLDNYGGGQVATIITRTAEVVNTHQFFTEDSERMRLTSTGLGIGTSSPEQKLDVNGIAQIKTTTSGTRKLRIKDSVTSQYFDIGVAISSSQPNLTFSDGADERMRIDSSGNLLVGTTSNDKDSTGASLRQAGDGYFTRNDTPLYLNRLSADGEILRLSKDGTTMGYVSTIGGTDIFFGSGDTGLRYRAAQDDIRPSNGTADRDNAIDLGDAGARFDDIFATNGTIQTSDQNEKQSIQSLTTAEMNVAKRLSQLIKTFKWNSAVEEKGASARTHTGIIAQDVQQAFTDEELDATNYALFISSTWWENSDGDVKEEATDGYNEKTRLGVRYPELLSFIQAYNDQRFTELEARITALETNNP